mgnify:CR=1 FL=1
MIITVILCFIHILYCFENKDTQYHQNILYLHIQLEPTIMRNLLVILLFIASNIVCLAQNDKGQNEKIFHIELCLKTPLSNPFSKCTLIKSQLFETKKNASVTFMKEVKLPSQQQIKINYKHETYEPTLLDAIGSQIYYILEDKLQNNWK